MGPTRLGERAGARLISVKLANVDDALKLVKLRRSLRYHGKLYCPDNEVFSTVFQQLIQTIANIHGY